MMKIFRGIGKAVVTMIGMFVVVLVLAVACSGDNGNTDTQEVTSETTKQETKAEQRKEEPSEFKEVVLVDNEYCKITITGIADSFGGYGYNTLVENKCNEPLLIGFNDVSVDGMMCDPCWATEVMAGKKDKREMVWYDDSIKSMDDLINIEGTFTISNADTWNSLGEVQVVINNK